MEELLNATPMNPSHPFAQLSNKFQQPIQAVDVQKAKKSPVTKVKTSNENPSSATTTGAEGAESSRGAPVIEVSDSISREKGQRMII